MDVRRWRVLAQRGAFVFVIAVLLTACGNNQKDPFAGGKATTLDKTPLRSVTFDSTGKMLFKTTAPAQVYGELLNSGGYYQGRCSSGTVEWDLYRSASPQQYAQNFTDQGLKTDHVCDFSKQANIRNGIDYQVRMTVYTPKPADEIQKIVKEKPAANGDVQALTNQSVYLVPVLGGGGAPRGKMVVTCLSGCT